MAICGEETTAGDACQQPAGACPFHGGDERCGEETLNGTPCRYPADSCPWHTDGEYAPVWLRLQREREFNWE